jgi:hypothetical protein
MVVTGYPVLPGEDRNGLGGEGCDRSSADVSAVQTPWYSTGQKHLAVLESAKTWGGLSAKGLFRPHEDWQTTAASGHRG